MADKTDGAGEHVQVLVKAMAVLELLAETQEDQSLGDIAAALSLNKSTCYRILTTLVSGDFVERPAPGTYRLGVGAFRIGSAMGQRMGIRERALPAMQHLFRTTGETVFLLIPRGDRAVCVERLDGRYASTHTLRVGGSLPLHLGAGPRLLLAALPASETETYVDGALESHHLPTQSAADALREEVERIRKQGYAVSRNDVEDGVTALSVAVRDHTGAVVAALSISGLTAHLPASEENAQVALLRDAADAASRALGHS